MDNITIGLLTSVVTEILKLFPFLRKNDLTVALTAIVVNVVGTYAFAGGTWGNFAQIVISSLVSYKVLVQPVASTLSLSTQK